MGKQEYDRLENTVPYSGKRILNWTILTAVVAGLLLSGVYLLNDRKYNLLSMMIAFLACVPFYLAYDQREGSIRRMVLLAVMTALAVTGRLLFGALPAFKPVAAIVILTGIYMGPEAGFLTGSLTALISNIFFGQGPWTPFQMFALGLIGLLAGLPVLRRILRKKTPLVFFGIFAGILYSGIMDIWTVFSLEGKWSGTRYLAALISALPYTFGYAASNVVFLLLTIKPIGEKLYRIQLKHGIF